MIQSVDFQQAKALLDTEKDLVFLDVREADEYSSGHAVGARLCPVDSIDATTAQACIPSTSTPVMVYCRSGFRSHRAAVKLKKLGYQRIYDLGSLAGWPYGITYGEE